MFLLQMQIIMMLYNGGAGDQGLPNQMVAPQSVRTEVGRGLSSTELIDMRMVCWGCMVWKVHPCGKFGGIFREAPLGLGVGRSIMQGVYGTVAAMPGVVQCWGRHARRSDGWWTRA